MAFSLTTDEQRLYNWALEALPDWFVAKERNKEDLKAFVKVVHAAQRHVEFMFDMTYIGRADNGGALDWLDQLGREIGFKRVSGESTDGYRDRLRNITPLVTIASIEDAANSYLAAQGYSLTVTVINPLRNNRFWWQADGSSISYWKTPSDDGIERFSTHLPSPYVIMLPYGCTEADRQAVEALAKKKQAAGFAVIVECRTSPP